jgi:hypothetical protein
MQKLIFLGWLNKIPVEKVNQKQFAWISTILKLSRGRRQAINTIRQNQGMLIIN